MVQVKAVIFGAIGVIVETSDLQRQAFNLAFAEAGLDWDWDWDADTYRRLLLINGGRTRLRAYRDEEPRRSDVTEAVISTLHERKTHYYAVLLARVSLPHARALPNLSRLALMPTS